ncbi:MAG TPA: 16S rRNA (adenine(1518)-N(6)/adenine(1519)-N(6))-dimethyltransferase, partial [Ruminococcus sp.]|nr:16S rRNA (adenine(1518)-N(6)/adenine(1519)-N(6))-dimethyltransferase [Ruminococcus sp.]
LENNLPIESITVMVQKEAADRLCAEIGTRNSGAITVGVNYYGNAEKLFSVSRGNFMPSPNVDSAVIRINIDHERKLDEIQEKFFFSMVKAGFSQRRKTIANALSQIDIDKQNVYSALENMGLSKSSRIEQLDMNQLIDLSVRLGN